ncbi:hypothetical protein Pmani_022845 [Petrolisthes manimaculis]|uniref:GAIN-B domain-containing protein n=1 Tax=Petrolisthes manimaculis TaxID=1843537 RepID=A0AAE1PBZ8_9EUCA|nr:hypothetical protein Pmani_022845 [Petrolisthes manimaculis]
MKMPIRSYCSIVSEPDDCLTNKSITVGIQMAKCQWVLAWSSSELNGSLEHTENLLYFNELNYHPDTGFYELFLDSETIGEATGTYSIGIGHYNMTEAVQEEHPCFEDPPPRHLYIQLCHGFQRELLLLETLSWSSEGCRVVGANTTITTCACNHLTSFGSGFFVAPNAIDFSYVFANAGFLDNLTIYLTLIISLALYFIGLVYARIKDRRDVEKVADNEPSDQYLYVLIVHTGHIPKSKHCITITREGGREGEGREVERERSGQGDKWTGREEEREINGGEERVERKDEERNVFLRPPRSRFTRVQRLSSCMALLYLSMLVNAMFYQKVPEDGAGGGLRLGPVSISPQALGIGFISNLIVFPPSFAIVFFFRKSRPRKVKESRLQIALRKQRESAVVVEVSQAVWSQRVAEISLTPWILNSTVSLKELIVQQEKDKDKNKVGRRRKLSLYWWLVLVACTGGLYWWLVLVACTGGLYWWLVLVACTDSSCPSFLKIWFYKKNNYYYHHYYYYYYQLM